VAAVADPEQQLAWESKQRVPAAIAAVLAGILTLGGDLWSGSIFRDVPRASYVESLQQALQPGPIGELPSVRGAFFQFYEDNAGVVLASACLRALGLLALGWAVTYLAVATRARREQFARPAVYVPLVGAVLSAVSTVLGAIGSSQAVSGFIDGAQTVDAARDVAGGSLLITAQFIGLAAQLALATGLVLVSLNAQRAGLLTRFIGVLGMITGALIIIPLGPLPVVQAFWLLALGMIFLDRVPGGSPPAWKTGKAEPWPSQQELAEARKAQQAAKRGDTGEPDSDADAAVATEPEATNGATRPSSRKRRRRS
jgi:hypothetical protein